VHKVQLKPINIQVRNPIQKEQKEHECAVDWCTGLSGAPGPYKSEPAILEKTKAHSAIIHRTVQWASGATATCAQWSTLMDEQCSTVTRQKSEQKVRGAPDCPVPHEDKASNVDQLLTLTVGWRGGAPDKEQCLFSGAPDSPVRPSPAAFSNSYKMVGRYKYHPTGHFKVWEPKQHIKAYSWHIQALPTTSIHWSISYTRFRPPQATQVPQKRDQAKESYSCEFSNSALWESLRESVCYILWSF
jgi:hypothetical protein